ncbi:MAG TPA: bifunctional 3-deoxy-7-phosphoheptulonate synthase/chorismate mutase type II [Flavobacteriaceae bacterium]|nr:bifunctional 3-deoxy-7-phosphoheptulonate synthase/chorismate mutase type II [Flavobacteriaceae bacterium]
MEKNKKPVNWLETFALAHPFVIAGPCSAETEDQIVETAHLLKNTSTSVLRAGLWKPRTRPGNFEGVGALGLKWLQRAKKETGLLIATEVANAVHVDLALKHDLDVLWIGARTTVSPFMVQEIADALRGTDKIVLVKNPVNPDLGLWLGAVERLASAEVKNLGVVHRGFSSYEKSIYRNNPEWQIPIDLRTQFPDLPLLLDPSHISGNRELIFELCQKALDLNYNGFMIEVHRDPENAWSDAEQQITPGFLSKIMENLIIREIKGEGNFLNDLEKLRTKIDVTDKQIIELFGKRMRIADEIGILKKENNVAILQAKRWKKVLDKMLKESKTENLSEEFVLRVYRAIHQESIDHQTGRSYEL